MSGPTLLRSLIALTTTMLLAACGVVTEPGAASGYSGTYDLVTIDGSAPPKTVTTGVSGIQMYVQSGQLAFTNAAVIVTLTGTLASNQNTATLGAQGLYTASDTAFTSDGGISGLVWSDSAAVTTTAATSLGAHVYRFARPSSGN